MTEIGERKIGLSELLDSEIFIRDGARDFLRLWGHVTNGKKSYAKIS